MEQNFTSFSPERRISPGVLQRIRDVDGVEVAGLRASAGEAVGDWVDRLEYPFRWRYSTLRALDHFRAASLLDDTPPDPRLADAMPMEVLRAQ